MQRDLIGGRNMAKKNIFNQVYICYGANCRDGLSYGACGTIQFIQMVRRFVSIT